MPLVLSCPLACGVRAWPWYEHQDQPARQADLTVGCLETVPPHAQQGIDINRFWDALGCNRWQVFRQPGRAASATSGTARIPRRQSWAVRAGTLVLLCAARSRRKGDFVGLPQLLSLQAPCLRPALQLGTQEGPCARLRYAHLSLSFGGTWHVDTCHWVCTRCVTEQGYLGCNQSSPTHSAKHLLFLNSGVQDTGTPGKAGVHLGLPSLKSFDAAAAGTQAPDPGPRGGSVPWSPGWWHFEVSVLEAGLWENIPGLSGGKVRPRVKGG